MKVINKKSIYKFVIYILIFFIIFFPVNLFNNFKIGQHILYVIIPIIIIIFSIVFMQKFKLNFIYTYLLLVFFLSLLGIFTKLSIIENINDFLYYFRYLIYSVIFIFAYNIGRIFNFYDLEKIIRFIFFLTFIFIIVQMLNYKLTYIISPRTLFYYNGIQIGGPFIWSYDYGFLLILFIYYFLNKIIFDFNIKNLLLFIANIILLIFTQSKSVYLSFIIGLLIWYYYLLIYFKIHFKKKFIILCLSLLLVLIIGILLINNLEYFYNIQRFVSSLINNYYDSSTATRLSQLQNISATLNYNIIFGYPIYHIIIENAYGYYFYYFGILGLLLYILLILLIILFIWKFLHLHIKSFSYNKLSIIILLSFFIHAISIFFISLSTTILDAPKVSYLFWLLIGLLFGISHINSTIKKY